ncbi:hypothetical protein EMIHUDRAFT_256647 [Emiliania huxleyi CCMP1516]|uniref:Uncharacterized protein n=2 Tax=Emiliania huxleyi TaxID=2903 RepID=A0A0D3ISF1_EMIH1|nr:hypothetical protein EMIHUDRAFT_256647 [Emiliania huxleyi CCMP1516]EOD14186.1 hypothetical protein EMIHUDRAFT_256647 [Emiliania huxleyi CCMP1516]|eukprot:XP_005766615.1 hypothetical protein EMIHUDRAFT_256647 [Emiliania huxleyi CCMP1516]
MPLSLTPVRANLEALPHKTQKHNYSQTYVTQGPERESTTVASDWLANELAEHGEIDAACRDKYVMHLMTAAGASAPADAVFRFTAGEAMQTEDDDEDTDRSEEYSDDKASD